MKAVILAAGQGTRLRPLTDNKPKCLVELAGRPILEHQLDTLRDAGIKEIHVVGGYKADQLEKYDLNIHINPRFAETNMVATLFCAMSAMDEDSDLIISYGDIVYEPAVINTLIECKAPVCLVVDREWKRYWAARMDDPMSDAETLKVIDDDRLVEVGKKPNNYEEIQGQYTGLIKVRCDFVENLYKIWNEMDRNIIYDGKDFDNMYMTSFFQYLIELGWECRAVFISNGWAEVDCEADLAVAPDFWKPSIRS